MDKVIFSRDIPSYTGYSEEINCLLEPVTEISQKDFFLKLDNIRFIRTHKYLIEEKDKITIFYMDNYALGITQTKYYYFGCLHSFRRSSKLGNSLYEVKCTKCGLSQDWDSSD